MSEMRRGRPTANKRWDNPSSVLVGDFIYSRAFELLVGIGDMAIMDVMAGTTNKISEGEVLQLVNQHNPRATEADYMQVILNKTAILFAAACKSAAILAGADATIQDNLHKFGLQVGLAFQLVDDVLDYTGSSDTMGKNVGDDLAEGKPTLPLIYVMQHGNDADRALIEKAVTHGGLDQLDAILETVIASGALDYTRVKARQCIDTALQCLDCLPDNPYRTGLEQVAEAALNRDS
jgi:octaprenyl-diphosphate synthase